MKHTKPLAVSALLSALTVVLMLLGTVLELGTYAAPMLASLCLLPVGERYGRRYQLLLWITASILCLLLIPAPEQNLMYAGLFGWYPIFRPVFERLPRWSRLPLKLLALNVPMLLIEALVLLVLVPEAMTTGLVFAFLVLMNVLFVLYDIALPLMHHLFRRIFRLL